METSRGEFHKTIRRSQSSIQSHPHQQTIKSSITPCERQACISQILKTTEIQTVVKFLHLSLRPNRSSSFLINFKYFIEVAYTNPPQVILSAKMAKHGPRIFPVGHFRSFAKPRKEPSVINSWVYHYIDMAWRGE